MSDTKPVTYCGQCYVTYGPRKRICDDCGNDELGKTTQPAWLECDHCGCEAIESKSGLFEDGQGEKCMTCDYPGTVDCDEWSHTATWRTQDYLGRWCNQPGCDECRPLLDSARAKVKT